MAQVFTFSNQIKQVPARHGFALRDAIVNSQPFGGTYLGAAVRYLNKKVAFDRLIVITDEQSHDTVPSPRTSGYMINPASNKHGVGYGEWIHIDGFSEATLDYIKQKEIIDMEIFRKTMVDSEE
jgi:60 kDa SS-A/Ro ribonucleoprotein